MSQASVPTEDADAFNQGVLVGQQAAISGLELDGSCVDLNVERPEPVHLVSEAVVEILPMVFGKAAQHLLSVSLEVVLLVINLSIGLQTHYDDPEQALQQGVTQLQQQMANVGFSSSLDLYLGAGVDTSVLGCELKLTAMFRRQDDAIVAAQSLGREKWLVVKWRSDQSGGLELIQAAGL